MELGLRVVKSRPHNLGLLQKANAEAVKMLTHELREDGRCVETLNVGGGLGIRYTDESPPEPAAYAAALKQRLGERRYEILIEPGRAIAGNAGVLLTRVEYLKPTPHKDFAIIDAAMNDLLRPALYQAVQEILPVERHTGGRSGEYDLVGPVCETGDFLGKGRRLSLAPGDLLAVRSSGAYGFTMASNYNSRPRVAELMVDGEQVHLIRQRETVADLFATESLLPD